MSMSPDAYSVIKRKYDKICNKANLLIRGIDSEGNTIPMIFFGEVKALIEEITDEIGQCKLGHKNLKHPEKSVKYLQMINQLNIYLDTLKNLNENDEL